jgi:hypothetical protein
VEGEAGAPWVIAPCRVDEEHVRRLLQCANRRLEGGPFPEGEQARFVRRAGLRLDHGGLGESHGRGPEPIAGEARAALAALRADEATANDRPIFEAEGCRIGFGERALDPH